MKIKNIIKTNKRIPTYDIEVKNEHHYFLENGVASHNTAVLMNSSASFLPVFNKFYYESMDSLNVPVTPEFIKNRFWYYNEGFTVPTENIIRLTTRLQYWIDTGMSMELVINPEITNMKKISDALLESFANGLKTVYYSRTLDMNNTNKKDNSAPCSSCAN